MQNFHPFLILPDLPQKITTNSGFSRLVDTLSYVPTPGRLKIKISGLKIWPSKNHTERRGSLEKSGKNQISWPATAEGAIQIPDFPD